MSNESPLESKDQIGLIRDIVFGSHIDKFEKRFEAIEAKQREITLHLSQKIEDGDLALQNELNQFKAQTISDINKLKEELFQWFSSEVRRIESSYVHRSVLSKLLVDMGQQLRIEAEASEFTDAHDFPITNINGNA